MDMTIKVTDLTINKDDREFMEKLADFVEAATALTEAWTRTGKPFVSGYPRYLPSFDDFVFDLASWRNAIMEAN